MPQKEPKFTRGEKCLFIHLIATFSLFLVVVIVYFVHLLVVGHKGDQSFSVSRRAFKVPSEIILPDVPYPIGFAYLNKIPHKIMCNVLLLREQWSAATAHCASIRSDPDMANMLEYWRIKYKRRDGIFIEVNVIKTIVHGQFNRVEFQNNIGLFQHDKVTSITPHIVNASPFFSTTQNHDNKQMFLINWDYVFDNKRHKNNLTAVYLLNLKKCVTQISLVIDEKREYEFCAKPVMVVSTQFDNGAVFVVDTKIIGIVSWGDRRGKGTPFVIIDLSPFQLWFDNAMNF